MRNRYTNLLPEERNRRLRREYFLRLGVVGVLMLAVLVGVYALLLVPTYLYLGRLEATNKDRLANVESTLASSDEAQLSRRLTALSQDARTLLALKQVPSAAGLIQSLLAVPRTGVSLASFAYTPKAGNAGGTLLISGTAATRDALRQYQLALQGAPFASSVDLPVSAYAKDTNISFSMTITLTSP